MFRLIKNVCPIHSTYHASTVLSESGGGGGARKPGARKQTMGRGKFHHRRDAGGNDGGDGSMLSMDPDGPYRTHLLFPGRKDDDAAPEMGRRSGGGGGSGFMKQVFGFGRKATDAKALQQQQQQQQEAAQK